jgi:hypothetical protein
MSQDDILDSLDEEDENSNTFLDGVSTDESDGIEELGDDQPVFPTPAIDVTVSSDRLYAYLSICLSRNFHRSLTRLPLMIFTKSWQAPKLSMASCLRKLTRL